MTSKPATCPAAEDLGAYLDGGLSPAERSSIEQHAVACTDCFELLAGAISFAAERDSQSEPRTLDGNWGSTANSPHGDWRSGRRWLTVVAALVPITIGAALIVARTGSQLPDPAVVAALAWSERLGGTHASVAAAQRAWAPPAPLAFHGQLTAQRRALRIAVHLVDARVALDAAAGPAAMAAVGRLRPLLPADGYGASGPLAASLDRLDPVTPAAERNEVLAVLGGRARQLGAATFDLGAWVETARLAALTGPPGAVSPLLLDPAFWSRLDDLRGEPSLRAEPALGRAVDALIDARPRSSRDLDALVRACEDVLLLE